MSHREPDHPPRGRWRALQTRLARARLAWNARRRPLPRDEWRRLTRRLWLIRSLRPVQRARLRVLTAWFLHRKHFSGTLGLDVSRSMATEVAAEASILLLGLDEDLQLAVFTGWREVVLYPDAFRVRRDHRNDDGTVHEYAQWQSGESWDRGPVILSWAEVREDGRYRTAGRHVVLHEFSHKLDMLNGAPNGMPPLHPEMSRKDWTDTFDAAYHELRSELEAGEPISLDPYAATSPAEFFSVATEYFYTDPELLRDVFPGVYAQLRRFYRFDSLLHYGG